MATEPTQPVDVPISAPSLTSSTREQSQDGVRSSGTGTQVMTSLFQEYNNDKTLPKKTRRYYKTQNELLNSIDDIQLHLDDYHSGSMSTAKKPFFTPSRVSMITFFINLGLFCAKAVAAALSGSLAVISSVLDSAVDLASGAILWYSTRAIKRVDYYLYPRGRRKLEPVAIMILAVIMSLASVQVIESSVQRIISYAGYDTDCQLKSYNESEVLCGTREELDELLGPCSSGAEGPIVELPTIIICCTTIVVKLTLYLVCRNMSNPTIQALAQDHRNDVVSNSTAIACGLIGYHLLKYIDPAGAIVISFYIIINWFITAYEQIKLLTGYTASREFINMLTWVIVNHDPRILYIDDLKAFHFGNNYFVEVDMVLPASMPIRESHDIGETLQIKLERLEEVERVFVHIDYETGYRHHLTSL
jgi:cation diffusion facilitator family transporter